MFLLPTFNAALVPCSVDAAAFEAHPQGHFCGHCRRVVQDFSQSQHPAADLAAARAASADGRVCGRFGAAQMLAPPPFSRRLRWFVVALVLVLGQGLTAREALGQVRRTASTHRSITTNKRLVNKSTITHTSHGADVADGMVTEGAEVPGNGVYSYVQQMPTFRSGNFDAATPYIQHQVRWPREAGRACVEGRVFASFTVDSTGKVRDARIVKSLHPLFDAEVLRVIESLTGFTPGRQNGKPVAVSMTVPITFRLK